MKKAFLIVNPVSGTLTGRGNFFRITEILTGVDILPTVFFTRGRGHAAQLAAEAVLSGEYDAIVCIGGDGTLNEVVTGMLGAGRSIPVGYIPAGTTNDFANGLGLKTKPVEAARDVAEALNGNRFREIDCGSFGDGRCFCYIASFGAFAASAYATPQKIKNRLGFLAYFFRGVADFFRIRPLHTCLAASVPDTGEGSPGIREIEGDFIFCGICNTYSVGKLVKLDDTVVNMSDGLFEVVLARKPKGFGQILKLMFAAMTSNIGSDMFVFFKTGSVKVRVSGGVDWTLDGELDSGVEEAQIRVIPRGVRLLVPETGLKAEGETDKKERETLK